MVAATRTIGPLHFEDLEPKRFEDLSRQLIYGFRNWRRLEATGRSGSDDGFDARAYEIASSSAIESDDDERDSDLPNARPEPDDKLWLLQCKRERTITPKKLARYVDDINLAPGESLHGVVFIAACDFSKKSRDIFRAKCLAIGAQEWHLWGKAELEDMLMQPQNDGLLFTYFGVSVTVRRRTEQAAIRSRLAIKRKVKRVLEPRTNSYMLIRSPSAVDYPHSDRIADFKTRPPWVVRRYTGMNYLGAAFVIAEHYTYLADDGISWDAALKYDNSRGGHNDYWADSDLEMAQESRMKLFDLWNQTPESNRAWLRVTGVVPYEDIVDIDENGDEYCDAPHVYAPFAIVKGPFKYRAMTVTTVMRWNERVLQLRELETGRIEHFPPEFR